MIVRMILDIVVFVMVQTLMTVEKGAPFDCKKIEKCLHFQNFSKIEYHFLESIFDITVNIYDYC